MSTDNIELRTAMSDTTKLELLIMEIAIILLYFSRGG